MKQRLAVRGRVAAVTAAALLFAQSSSGQSLNDPMPPFSNGARILFQGDSITDGNRGRSDDPNHILGHGYQFIIAAKYGAALPGRQLTFINRGNSGDRVSDLARRWQSDALDLKPDILSILIGVNDLNPGESESQFREEYDRLLNETVEALPHVRLVLCEPFGLPVGGKKAIWGAYRGELALRVAIVNDLAKKYHATIVHFQKMFEDATKRAPAEYWIWDGVHPTYSGHQLMADEWSRAVRDMDTQASIKKPLPDDRDQHQVNRNNSVIAPKPTRSMLHALRGTNDFHPS